MIQSDIESWITIDEILADVTVGISDVKMRLIDKGFYVRIVKETLRDLNYKTHFDWRWGDYEMPANLMLPFPSKGFNLIDIFIYHPPSANQPCGSNAITDCCGITDPVRVFWKAGMATRGQGTGYTAKVKPYMSDPFYSSCIQENNVFFFNVQAGMIMFSESCKGYEKVRVYFNGDPCDVPGFKIVPPMVREGVTMHSISKAFFFLAGYLKDPFYLTMWKASLLAEKQPWQDAQYYMKKMSSKERTDLFTYINRMSY
jgi:hypothetical protein